MKCFCFLIFITLIFSPAINAQKQCDSWTYKPGASETTAVGNHPSSVKASNNNAPQEQGDGGQCGKQHCGICTNGNSGKHTFGVASNCIDKKSNAASATVNCFSYSKIASHFECSSRDPTSHPSKGADYKCKSMTKFMKCDPAFCS